MLVLIADKFPEHGQAALRSLGIAVEYQPDLDAERLPAVLASCQAQALVVRSTEVREAVFVAAPALSLVIRAGAGVNTIDTVAASARGVYVANCPGRNAVAVAELTLGLILALDRRIPDAVAEMRAGTWNKKKYSKANGLLGRTLGLVGFGAIAREVAARARAFGMRVQAWSRTLDDAIAEAHDVTRADGLEALLSTSDVISVHVPHGSSTHHLIGERELSMCRPGALFVHTARGGVVDDQALLAAVQAGRMRAASDVLEHEPTVAQGECASPLCRSEGIYLTPHIAASTEQAESAIAGEVVRILREYLDRGSVPNTVNIVTDRAARWTIVVRHLDRVGVLARILEALREHDLNVQEMQNVVFTGNVAAIATITLEREPSEALIQRLARQDEILAIEVRAVVSA